MSKTFTLRVRLEQPHAYHQPVWLTGARALDFCRAHGLPESLTVPRAGGYCGATDRVIEVPELIAREVFADTQTTAIVTVQPDDLIPGEIVPAHYHRGIEEYRERWAGEIDNHELRSTLAVGPITLERALVLRQIVGLRARAESAERERDDLRRRVAELETEVENLETEVSLLDSLVDQD